MLVLVWRPAARLASHRTPHTVMAYLIIGDERIALQIGENTLGGSADDAVEAPALAGRAPFATISVYLEVATTIRRASPATRVSVDGTSLGEEPRELAHGSRIESDGLTIMFGDLRTVGSTTRVAGVTDDELGLPGDTGDGDVAGDSGGVLHSLGDGRTYVVADAGLTIGRDPSCGLVLAGRDVSRVHAVIAPSLRGYTIADHGVNGVLVNGNRVDGSRVLRRGDVIRIGEQEFRFDADAASFDPPEALTASARPPAGAASRSAPEAETASGAPRGGTTLRQSGPGQQLVATLEVVTEGPLRGQRFRIESALAHIGRADHNSVRLPDASVSGSHATLLHRTGTWHLTDLGSTNGTYVDGDRVTGERALRGAAEIRVGDIRMIFRPLAAPAAPSATRGIVGVTDEQANKARTGGSSGSRGAGSGVE